jgi:4-aminobutyrate aminotransferase-like enzyme/Ser/Thr protein kinase RdoA (MazF antagonist)
MSTVALAPHFPTEEAARLARDLYGLVVFARPLPSERDQNFHLQTAAGQEYVLKIAGAAEERSVLDLQNQAILHLAQVAPTLSALRICLTRSGALITEVTAPTGGVHLVRLLTYLPGTPLAKVNPHTPALLARLGAYLGELDKALASFVHPAALRELHWDLRQASAVIRRHQHEIGDPVRRILVAQMLAHFEQHALPHLASLRTSVIHNDGNDYNVIVSPPSATPGAPRQIVGVIDFGDMVQSHTVGEVAIAAAYAMLDKADPLAAAAQVVGGYHTVHPLEERELALLYPLITMRLCMSVVLAAHQQRLEPNNPYLSISERPAWALLEKLQNIPPQLAHYTLRLACGLPPCPQTPRLVRWLQEQATHLGQVVDVDLRHTPTCLVDLSVGSHLVAASQGLSTAEWSARIAQGINQAGAAVGIGRYNEARLVYTGEQFQTTSEELPEQRTVHLGIDLFLPAGSPVYAPLDGVVHAFANNTAHHDYGPVVILAHQVAQPSTTGQMDLTFYTLYGHLSEESLAALRIGQPLPRGERIGAIGNYPVNGDWPPHLHFQIITDLLDAGVDFDGVAAPSQRELWLSLSPDPNLILQLPPSALPAAARPQNELLAARRQRLGRNLSISYKRPLKMVRGWRQFLYDEAGRAYLDVVNNVCHVGHCHPRVVRAGQEQMAVLNTNTRYLHDHIVEYAQRLTVTLPDPLRVCFFVNSGSEANDLALRLARTYTTQRDLICLDVAYHGNLTSLIDISPYKFAGPGGQGAPATTHVAPMPDPYRGRYRGRESGAAYAEEVGRLIDQLAEQGRGVAAFIAESLLGCGGQIVLPDGYLAAVYERVRAAGGVCIADEVQVGFGRVGTHFWGFETQGVVPDMVSMGKPIGNGHPLGAVVTTPQIAEAFANGMEYFNTFGGNPVSCAIGLAVLDVMADEGLQAHALAVGERLMSGLRGLMARYSLVGDVRGLGLFVGVELVLDRATLAPAGDHAAYIAERMRDHGILISTDGPFHNVLKLKPPLPFTAADADRLVATLDKILAEDGVRV